jgi:hypothetical protein
MYFVTEKCPLVARSSAEFACQRDRNRRPECEFEVGSPSSHRHGQMVGPTDESNCLRFPRNGYQQQGCVIDTNDIVDDRQPFAVINGYPSPEVARRARPTTRPTWLISSATAALSK